MPQWIHAAFGRSKGWKQQQFKWLDWRKPIPLDRCYSDRDTRMLRLPSGQWYQRVDISENAAEV